VGSPLRAASGATSKPPLPDKPAFPINGTRWVPFFLLPYNTGMARIVFAWELGGDYGHIARMLPLALELRRRGHDPVFVIRELRGAELLLAPHGMQWFQAPLWLGHVTNLPDAAGYAEMLMRFGFLNARSLTSIARAWRNLLLLLRADMIVMDHAPTALLATRGLGLRRVNLGDGFCIPPAARPLPLFMWWQRGNTVRQADSEERVRQVANETLFALDAPPLMTLAELFDCDLQLVSSFPELDHYPDRQGGDFIGPLFTLGQGAPVLWPEGDAPRVFVYLKAEYAGLERALVALRDAPLRVLAHVPGAARDTLKRHTSATLRFSEAPLDIEAARSSCDLAICHGGHGTVSAMLLAGKPLLLLPMQMEQAMTAHSLEKRGVALSAMPEAAAQLQRLVKRALGEPRLAAAARAVAANYPGYDQAATVTLAADRCSALLESPA